MDATAKMIHFITIFFKCHHDEQIAIEDQFGMERAATVNGEWSAILNDEQYKLIQEIQNQGKITIRNKFFTVMNTSKLFISRIKEYLKSEADNDPMFAKKMAEHPEKTAEATCNYILSEVLKSEVRGYDDAEVYSLAKHFIDEDSIIEPKLDDNICSKVVVNKHIELTEDEKKKAKEEALKEYQKSVRRKAEKEAELRAEKEKAAIERKKLAALKKRNEDKQQLDLFGGM